MSSATAPITDTNPTAADPGRINWPEPVRAAARAVGVELPR